MPRIFLAAIAALFAVVPAAAQVQVQTPSQLPGIALPSPEWQQAPADGDKGPAVGGRAYLRYRVAAPVAVLASFDQVSRLTSPPSDASDVAADPLYGDTRLTLTMAGFGTRSLRPAAALASAVNASGQLIRIWTKPIANVDPRLADYRIRLYSEGSPASPGANYHVFNASSLIREGQKGGEQRWGSFTIPVAAFTATGTGANLSAWTWAMVEVAPNSSSSTVLAVGNVEVVGNALAKAKMIIGFDDQYPASIAYASRAMARYGFRGVLYLSPAIDTGRAGKLAPVMLKSLHDNLGWQIASQAWSTEAATGAGGIDTMTADQRTAEMAKLRNWQNGMGLTGGGHGSYFSNVGSAT
ncbi:hypothetical protein [Sphingomonas yabuuchiae]|uniref:hypothetical protein n=1 Tax=Sphingomonas yabuuchiae TaxID=172044 RepID=UPI003D963556